ncbi:MAG TPA: flagellar basal body rod protein FlgB [Mariprofundaceae bacterium]|nr:flagellar basal body rod protein FlgB [Mariprofundaceae bacterium]
MSNFLFGSEFHRLETALSARERLQSVRAANIANADTPNYKADTRTFDDIFHGMLKSDGSQMARTNPRHMEAGASGQDSLAAFSKHAGVARMDGNTVDVQKEMEQLAENQLMHEYTLRLIEDHLQGIKSAIKQGGQ